MTVQIEHYGAREPTHRQKVKEWLNQARLLEKQIDSKNEQIARMRSLVNRCTQSISPASGCGRRDWTDTVARLKVLEDAINCDIDRLLEVKMQINEAIAKLPTPEMQLLLEKRYFKGFGWNKIAREMNFSRATVFRVHDSALDLIEIPKVETL